MNIFSNLKCKYSSVVNFFTFTVDFVEITRPKSEIVSQKLHDAGGVRVGIFF
jgi:hypothetical protein